MEDTQLAPARFPTGSTVYFLNGSFEIVEAKILRFDESRNCYVAHCPEFGNFLAQDDDLFEMKEDAQDRARLRIFSRAAVAVANLLDESN